MVSTGDNYFLFANLNDRHLLNIADYQYDINAIDQNSSQCTYVKIGTLHIKDVKIFVGCVFAFQNDIKYQR